MSVELFAQRIRDAAGAGSALRPRGGGSKDFYGNAPRVSYFTGCSSGGRQGLREAQQFPADYDGIVSGAPTLDWSGFIIADMSGSPGAICKGVI